MSHYAISTLFHRHLMVRWYHAKEDFPVQQLHLVVCIFKCL